ncbi:tudor domain-containing protein 3 isoform X2 [Anoplophora glabripennis]|uniref:tudor domain-containing protein 3 isoform X2 n=1 Tax=Anoplophora glabripennis TaxID=217634 RepID=UPI0008737C19|nr:tudor domain-containing protein 3 isoform X2 [Anoplophora glabripennis]
MTSILGSDWNISSDGINVITENGSIKDYNKVLALALNIDLKEIGSPVLTKELAKQRTSKLVLQIQKIRNISAPKANEDSQAAPRMLKLVLTDGDNHVQAIEITTINSISRNNTPPGTKILINNASVVSGYILLNSNNCTVLGGKVPHLVEKWEIARSIQRNKRGNSPNEDGPPPWVNFGTKIQTGDQDGNFKSLGIKNKEAAKDNSEFELQRQGAIAEASAGAVRKVFGGRVKQNVQPIISNQNRPNKERQEKVKFKGKSLTKEKDVEDKPVRPSEKVSLFAFLEDKLPLSENQTTAKSTSSTESQNNPRNLSLNANKHYEGQNKPYSQQNYHYQNYNQQNYNDKHPAAQNRYEKNNSQQNMNQYSSKPFDKQQSNNYSKYPYHNKQDNSPKPFDKQQSNNYSKYPNHDNQDNINSNPRQYEKPKQSSKVSQGNCNTQKEDQNDLSNNMNKMSLNSQFASRSLRQHLNLGPVKKSEEPSKRNEVVQNSTFNIGDECMAKYWEDGKFYNAVITAITDRTYAVRFKGYGNIEEILKTDCFPVSSSNNKQNYGQNQSNRRYDQNGSVEFRRSNRNYK